MAMSASPIPWASIVGRVAAASMAMAPKDLTMPMTVPSSPTMGEMVPMSARYATCWLSALACRTPSVWAISRISAHRGLRILREEIHDAFDDARNRFVVAVRNGKQSKKVPLANQGIRGLHEALCDHAPPAEGKQEGNDQCDSDYRKKSERDHRWAARLYDLPKIRRLYEFSGGLAFRSLAP